MWTLLLFLGLVAVRVECRQRVYSSCIDRRGRTYTLKCEGQFGRIVNVDYSAGAGSCKDRLCYGESADLLIYMNGCFLTKTCKVPLPSDPIIKSQNDLSCFAKSVEFLELKGYKCFDNSNESIFDICTSGNDMKNATSGIIVSHSAYPWNYDNINDNCSLTIMMRDNQTLRYTVMKLDTYILDNITVIGRADKVPAKNPPVSVSKGGAVGNVTQKPSNQDTKVIFNFIKHDYSLFGRGFVICFKLYSPSDPKVDVCSDITTGGHLKSSGRDRGNKCRKRKKPADDNCKPEKKTRKRKKRQNKIDTKS